MRLLFLLGFLAAADIVDASCFDVSKAQPATLSGILSRRVFAGPPEFQDVSKGDAPEPGYVLKLPTPICLTGDPDFTYPADMFDEVQIVPRDTTAGRMEQLDGQSVTIRLSDQMPAHTGHHHRPLVAWADEIIRDGGNDGGDAADVVRAFYRALALGNGEAASGLVVAEKRGKGPFTAHALTGFYGSLSKPIKLTDLNDEGNGNYSVHYRYVAGSKACNGKAMVGTVKRDEIFLIATIDAFDGC